MKKCLGDRVTDTDLECEVSMGGYCDSTCGENTRCKKYSKDKTKTDQYKCTWHDGSDAKTKPAPDKNVIWYDSASGKKRCGKEAFPCCTNGTVQWWGQEANVQTAGKCSHQPQFPTCNISARTDNVGLVMPGSGSLCLTSENDLGKCIEITSGDGSGKAFFEKRQDYVWEGDCKTQPDITSNKLCTSNTTCLTDPRDIGSNVGRQKFNCCTNKQYEWWQNNPGDANPGDCKAYKPIKCKDPQYGRVCCSNSKGQWWQDEEGTSNGATSGTCGLKW